MLRQSASLILARPAAKGEYQVLLVKRSATGSFKSLHVFPGGALDPVADEPAHYDTPPNSALGALGICAIRETFEETGIGIFSQAPPAQIPAAQWSQARRTDSGSPLAFAEFCRAARVSVNTPGLACWARWITPTHLKKRFDTYFFLKCLEDSDVIDYASPDGAETVSLDWASPRSHLARFHAGEISLFPPQFCLLTELVESFPRFSDLDQAVRPDPPVVNLPVFLENGVSLLPGDEAYPLPFPGLPGQKVNRLEFKVDGRGAFTDFQWVRSPDFLAKSKL